MSNDHYINEEENNPQEEGNPEETWYYHTLADFEEMIRKYGAMRVMEDCLAPTRVALAEYWDGRA